MSEENVFQELGDEESLETVESIDPSSGSKDVLQIDEMTVQSPEWNDYVMSLFTEDEVLDDKPLVSGLRRVAELLLGRIVYSAPTQVFPSTDPNGVGRATVVYEVRFEDGTVFADVADVWYLNCPTSVNVYTVATASTRAEARALRKALRLKSIAAEEIAGVNVENEAQELIRQSQHKQVTGEFQGEEMISDRQRNHITVKCEQLNINIDKFMDEVLGIPDKTRTTKRQASQAIDMLNSFQRGQDDDGNKLEIPSSIIGYVSKEG